MSVVKEEYHELPPKGEKLADVVVLAQAWKKSHTYIRRHNWYADVLELDVSTIDLEDRLVQWAKEVRTEDFKPNDLLLVPAPKNASWVFAPTPTFTSPEQLLEMDLNALGSDPAFNDWRPGTSGFDERAVIARSTDDAQKLRPLAHLSIRDQTLATAVMMCLAEVVETAQGDPTGAELHVTRADGVVSYGNRLHCTWARTHGVKPRARFSWGNSRTYRQYFQDYRAFLARPRQVCAEVASQLSGKRELYVISLDIKSFFDHVDRNALLNELKLLECEHRQSHRLPESLAADATFWERTNRFFSWQWRHADQQQADLIHGSGQAQLQLGLNRPGFRGGWLV